MPNCSVDIRKGKVKTNKENTPLGHKERRQMGKTDKRGDEKGA